MSNGLNLKQLCKAYMLLSPKLLLNYPWFVNKNLNMKITICSVSAIPRLFTANRYSLKGMVEQSSLFPPYRMHSANNAGISIKPKDKEAQNQTSFLMKSGGNDIFIQINILAFKGDDCRPCFIIRRPRQKESIPQLANEINVLKTLQKGSREVEETMIRNIFLIFKALWM